MTRIIAASCTCQTRVIRGETDGVETGVRTFCTKFGIWAQGVDGILISKLQRLDESKLSFIWCWLTLAGWWWVVCLEIKRGARKNFPHTLAVCDSSANFCEQRGPGGFLRRKARKRKSQRQTPGSRLFNFLTSTYWLYKLNKYKPVQAPPTVHVRGFKRAKTDTEHIARVRLTPPPHHPYTTHTTHCRSFKFHINADVDINILIRHRRFILRKTQSSMTTRPPRSLSVETAERHQDYQSMLGSAVSPPSSSSITTSNLFNNESCSSSSSSHRAQLGFSSFNYPGYGQRFGADAGPGAATSAERRNEVVTSSSMSLEQDLLTSSSLSLEQDLLLLDLENNRNHEPSWRNRSEQLHNHPHQATQPSQRRLRAPAPPAPAPPSLPPSPPLSPSLSPSPPQSPNSCYLSTPFIIGSASPTMINERLPQINAATDASSVHEQKYSRLVKNCKRVLVVGISLILIVSIMGKSNN